MKKTLAALFAVLSLVGAVAQEPQTIRMDITSQPSGATVAIDGMVRGVTPLTLLDVKPGKRLVSVSAPGYRTYDEFVVPQRGLPNQKHYELRQEKGILLVRTEPAGCDVQYNRLSIGTTPLLITSFATGEAHEITLSQNGYSTKTVSVTLDGRRPKVIDETMTLDSGILDISSDPAGAEVIVGGITKGTTPVRVERVPRGIVTVTLKLNGYEDLTRELTITPGDTQNLSVKMKGRPTRLTIVSIPEKARVYVDDQFQGRSPVSVSVEGGSHRVRAELPGYAPLSRSVTVENGDDVTEEFRLQSVLGRLEITTINGTVKRGQLLEQTDMGTYRIETRPGLEETISADDIKSVKPLE